MHDPDARGGAGWWHWFAYDLPATATGLAEGAKLPEGAAQVKNDFGDAGYDGPCPPKGDKPHHYHFTLYALKSAKLAIPPDATPAQAEAAVKADAIGQAGFVATYGR